MKSKPAEKLGAYFKSRREKGEAGLPTMSVTLDRGLVMRDSIDRKMETNLAPEEHLKVHPGDIAYNMMRMWQGASGIALAEGLVSPAYVVLAPKPNVDAVYASYLFKTSEMIHRFWAYSYGLTDDRLRLYPRDFTLIPANLPPLPEQQKIAEILSTWDKAIETTEALLANARTQKRALMQSLLKGELGLNGRSNPLNHKFGRLGSGIKLISGQHIDAEMVNEEGYGTPYLTGPADFSDGEICVTKFTTAPKVLCDRGDILITVKGSGTGKTIVADQSYCISRQLMAIRPVSFEPRWIRYVIELDQENYRSAAAGLIPGIGRSEILDKIVSIPSYYDQTQIAELIHTSENIEKRQLRGLQALRTEKKSLMQQLLTGKRRVVV